MSREPEVGLADGDPGEHAVQVVAREGPCEGLGDLAVVLAEGQEPAPERMAFGRERLALHDGEAALDLVEPEAWMGRWISLALLAERRGRGSAARRDVPGALGGRAVITDEGGLRVQVAGLAPCMASLLTTAHGRLGWVRRQRPRPLGPPGPAGPDVRTSAGGRLPASRPLPAAPRRWTADRRARRPGTLGRASRELTAHNRLLVPIETVVGQVNAFLRGWAGYFRYGDSARALDTIRRFAFLRLALFVAKRHKRSRSFGTGERSCIARPTSRG